MEKSQNNPIKLMDESVATEKYQLKTHMRDLFNGWQYEESLKDYIFLVVDGDCEFNSHLVLDFNDDTWATDARDWRKSLNILDDTNIDDNFGIRGLIVNGNLTVNGNIVNHSMEGGAFLLVMGNVTAHNFVGGGAHINVKGDANVRDVIYGHYNDGSLHIEGDTSARVLLNDDHDFYYQNLKNNAFKYDSNSLENDKTWYDEEDEVQIPKKLGALLVDKIKTYEDLTASLRDGEYVFKEVK